MLGQPLRDGLMSTFEKICVIRIPNRISTIFLSLSPKVPLLVQIYGRFLSCFIIAKFPNFLKIDDVLKKTKTFIIFFTEYFLSWKGYAVYFEAK